MNELEKTYDEIKNEIVLSEKNKNREYFNSLYSSQYKEINKLLSNFLDEKQLSESIDSDGYNKIESKIGGLTAGEKRKLLTRYTPTNYNYAVGFLILPAIKDKIGKKKNITSFLKWGDIALRNSNNRYILPNDESEQINEVIKAYINDGKNFNIKYFDQLSSVLQKSGAEEMLDTYKWLLDEAVKDYNDGLTKIPFKYRKKEDTYKTQLFNDFQRRFTTCLNDICAFLNYQIENSSFSWYLKMSAYKLNAIFETAKDVKNQQTGETILKTCHNEINSFLIKLLSYYVETSRRVLNSDNNINTDEKWNLSEIFELVGILSDNPNLKREILQQYLVTDERNKNYPLPSDLIEDSLFNKDTNADLSFKKDLLDMLKKKYERFPNHIIEDKIRMLIKDNSVDWELRSYAMSLGIFKEYSRLQEAVFYLVSDNVEKINQSKKYIDIIIEEMKKNPDEFRERSHDVIEALSADKMPSELRKYLLEKILRK